MNSTLKRIAGLAIAAGLAFGATALAADFTWTLEPTPEIMDAGEIGNNYEYHESLGTAFTSTQLRRKGMMTADGKVTIPAEYKEIYATFENGNVLVWIENGMAIIDSANNVVVEEGKYSDMQKADENTLVVYQEPNYGLISSDGKEITGQIFSRIIKLYRNDIDRYDENYFLAQKDGFWGLIDKTGKTIIPFEHKGEIALLADNLYYVGADYNATERYIIDINGKVIVGPEDLAGARVYADNKIEITKKDLSISFINTDGTPFDSHGYRIINVVGDYYIVLKDEKTGVVDKNFNVVTPCKYYGFRRYTEGVYIAQMDIHGSEEVYVDIKGNPITKYDGYEVFEVVDGYTIVSKNYRYGIMDANGELVVPCEYGRITYIGNGVYVIPTHSGKRGFATLGGDGKKVKDTFEGLILQVGSNDIVAFGEPGKTDAAPIIRNGRTMLPARLVAEALGATVGWDAATKTVIITPKNGYPIHITIGSTEVKVGPYTTTLDAPAFIENGRTYTPVRYVAEALGGIVSWDASTKTVKILK